MKTNLTPDRKRISRDEYDALTSLEAVHAVLESKKVQPVLAERFKSVRYAARDYAMLTSALGRLLRNVYNTVPYEQLKNLSHNIKLTAVHVGVHIKGRTQDSEYGMCLSWNQISELMKAASETCLVCDLDPQEQRKCPLAKVLNELPGRKNENSTGCGWYGL